ncbi:MAG: bifunctional salicylyl-CoA 5-hydroxylase/oxidoreductase [Deltaproteobacteria bacterium]|nr:bifunctional salicylyl-CoA 5-hydroxylase/oxidoreductase [Deltaproteobacteria bacterium]
MGGGPGALYLGILLKKANAQHEVVIYERNRPHDTFGFGVVFSDQTLGNLAEADPESYRAITESFAHWDDIDIHFKGQVLTSTGHGFSGLSRGRLLEILEGRARALGVQIEYQREILDPTGLDADLIVAADGVNSLTRTRYAAELGPTIDFRPNKFVWLGTTFPFGAFTFYFKENQDGLWRVHAYRYDREHSTFIVECTEETWKQTGLGVEDEDATIDYFESLFSSELAGHPLLKNRSIWRNFPNISNERWFTGNVVLLGDAAHTAHFSIGSGTKLAMEDAIALADALRVSAKVPEALATYEAMRRPQVESTRRAAQVSLEWFESAERYMKLEPVQFAMSLLTRSLRVTHANLKVRDPSFVEQVDRWFAGRAFAQAGLQTPSVAPPPMFTPLRLRELVLSNRVVVSPMCQYSAEDGTIDDWHLVHLGSRAVGGAGLVITEMTDVSREGRISPGCAGMYRPEHVPAWKRVVDFVHRHSKAKIGVQLAHAGRKGSAQRLWERPDHPLEQGNWPLIGPSPIPYLPKSQVPREMNADDMRQVRADFVRSAQMAGEAGFDLIELHFAHGYLLGSFISPLTNRRLDEYGGTIAARARFPLEVFDDVRKVWPEHKPISVRISATDWATGGQSLEDTIELARLLKARGADILDVSAGQTVSDQKPRYGRLFQTPFSDRVRLETGMPTMTVGNIASFADVNSILAAGRADLCVLARAHLFDPYWTHHAAQAQGFELEWPDQYQSVTRYSPRFD